VIVTYEGYRIVFNKVKEFFTGGAGDRPPEDEGPSPPAEPVLDQDEGAIAPYWEVFGSVPPWDYLAG
jgi:hypothetical protein